jgi:serine/threonine protein kinase
MPFASGTQLGPYEILSSIGAGGMGEVYKARDTGLNRTVAIKVLPEHISNQPEARARFKREAETIAALNHPHICTLYDVGRHETEFLVMEFLEGETLAQRVQRGALPLDEVLRYAVEIADALDQAHGQGVIHRDLKPGNVMLTKRGTKLLDFGLARPSTVPFGTSAGMLSTAATAQPLTIEGTILGTVQYMSPEQLDGKELDFRADIFSFAVIVYEGACGKNPFFSSSIPSMMANILTQQPQPLTKAGPAVPPELDRIISKCLRKNRDERYQSTRDLLVDLRHLTDEFTEPLRVGGNVSEAALPQRRSAVWWWVHHLASMMLTTPLVVALSWNAHKFISPTMRDPVFLFNALALGLHWSARFALVSQAFGNPSHLSAQARRMRPWLLGTGVPVVAGLLASAFFVANSDVILAALCAALAMGGVAHLLFLDPAVQRAAFPGSIEG